VSEPTKEDVKRVNARLATFMGLGSLINENGDLLKAPLYTESLDALEEVWDRLRIGPNEGNKSIVAFMVMSRANHYCYMNGHPLKYAAALATVDRLEDLDLRAKEAP
jgi:hypothetical protein